MQLGIVMEKNWVLPVDQCWLQALQFSVHLIDLPSILLRSVTQAHCLPFSTVAADTPTACCFSYISWQIPQNFIADYFETSSQCSKPSVIFLTKRGRQVCADPSEEWVQKYVSDLELSA
ncbi:C-C motif chemokine 3-like [Pan troglodytes]|uniref:C-C motif chemokine 3-like n=1 Tax=Pan troglodytes TaxID=9598 RepID=UPI00301333AF